MANLEALRSSAIGQIWGPSSRPSMSSTRRGSLSNIGRASGPSSRPSTMRERRSFSSSVNQPRSETLFIDTPQNPGTSFIFPLSKHDVQPPALEESRPVSHAGSVFSVQTSIRTSTNEGPPQVEFGKTLPVGYQKIPAFTIRRIERNDSTGLTRSHPPASSDSPFAPEHPSTVEATNFGGAQPVDTDSRASKWSTKPQTNTTELVEQESLMQDAVDETRKENFAIRGCLKLARALSSRLGNNSVPVRFRSLRWKTGRAGAKTPYDELEDPSNFVLRDRQVNVGVRNDG